MKLTTIFHVQWANPSKIESKRVESAQNNLMTQVLAAAFSGVAPAAAARLRVAKGSPMLQECECFVGHKLFIFDDSSCVKTWIGRV